MSDVSRRPAAVVQRDETVSISLVLGPKTLAQVAEELGMASNQVYGAFWRLRRQGFVEKTRVGSRTPVWQLTPEGQTYVQQVQAAQAAAAVPVG